MSEFFSCYLWWVILGILLGFFLLWLYDRIFHRDGGPDQKNIREILRLRDEIESLEAQISTSNNNSSAAALASRFGFLKQKRGKDNLKLVSGIGPKIMLLLNQQGIQTFQTLSNTNVAELQKILDDNGSAFKLAKPESWPEQSQLIEKEDWQALKELKDSLIYLSTKN